MYIGTALVFFLIAVVFAVLMRTQLIRPEMGFLSPEAYNQIFSMHGTTMVFLFGMPILIGLGNYLVPLQIGARDMAFPRANALSYWLLLFGGLVLYSSFFFGGALDTGWFSYAPLTLKAYSPHDGVTFWIVSLSLLGGSSILGAINFIVTCLRFRAPGMKFSQMPIFSIATFINSFLILFAIPSLTRRARPALLRPPVRHQLLRPDGRRRPHHLAAPLLVLRPPGGVHPHPAGVRHPERGRARLLAQAALRARAP